jgi:hypothetical protein
MHVRLDSVVGAVPLPSRPNVVEPLTGIAAWWLRSPIVTAVPDWLSVAFHVCLIACEPGHEAATAAGQMELGLGRAQPLDARTGSSGA